MSVPYSGPPGGPGWDPKAQAKADKAYRKAQRPFYKKKRFIIPAALLARGFHGYCSGERVDELKSAPDQQGCDLSKEHIALIEEHLSGEEA